MKTILFIGTPLVLVACAALPKTDTHPVVGTVVAPVSLSRVEAGHEGETIALPTPGKVTVVDFWMSYCEPCIKEMPALEQMWQGFDKRKVAIIGVCVDNDDSAIRQTLEKTLPVKITFPIVFDEKAAKLESIYQFHATVPATFVVDPQGRVRFFFDGSDGDLNRLEKVVQALSLE